MYSIQVMPLINPLSYGHYKSLVETLVLENKTTGREQTPERIAFTRLNLQRMKRVEKQFAFLPELEALLKEQKPHWRWLLLTEAWCGDGAQTIPAIAAIAQAIPSIELLLVQRDENEALMDTCLTNGSKSIPMLICEDHKTGERLFTWGPRPTSIQERLIAFKAVNPGVRHEDLMQQLHAWYAKDRSISLQQDLLRLVKEEL
ncbi:thioredoxin family protein [Nibribacter koreensis]|uniref:Thioredoxin family protein n=1 Tax=Nibribacter koreensis TaxID=1084519 RepID=A0ABP8FDS0_9BACT